MNYKEFLQCNLFNRISEQCCDIDVISNITLNAPGFGEKEIRNLCKWIVLPEIVTVNAFCDYYDNIGNRIPCDLKPLLEYCKSWLWHHHSAVDKRGLKTTSQNHRENELWKYN